MEIKEHVTLAEHTSIRLGGPARYFIVCKTIDDIADALTFSNAERLKVCVMAGGSNLIFKDEGFNGAIIKIDLKGVNIKDEGKSYLIRAAAGESWDELVEKTSGLGLTGIECMSGIPGTVGATPVQNVGAYGQEVCDVIENVEAIDRNTHENIVLSNEECRFGYRQSRFKKEDKDKFIITSVSYRFIKNKQPEIKYEQLREFISRQNIGRDKTAYPEIIRECVLKLRKSKAMVLDPNDPDSVSCGSFFTNPVLNQSQFMEFKNKVSGDLSDMNFYETDGKYKIPAAWLIERSGFKKGHVKSGVGISSKHSLALININGTTKALMSLASEIQEGVKKRFSIRIEREPEYIE